MGKGTGAASNHHADVRRRIAIGNDGAVPPLPKPCVWLSSPIQGARVPPLSKPCVWLTSPYTTRVADIPLIQRVWLTSPYTRRVADSPLIQRVWLTSPYTRGTCSTRARASGCAMVLGIGCCSCGNKHHLAEALLLPLHAKKAEAWDRQQGGQCAAHASIRAAGAITSGHGVRACIWPTINGPIRVADLPVEHNTNMRLEGLLVCTSKLDSGHAIIAGHLVGAMQPMQPMHELVLK